jgi:DNA-binding PadR family transcriptional regulator
MKYPAINLLDSSSLSNKRGVAMDDARGFLFSNSPKDGDFGIWLEKLVKSNREILILSILNEQPRSSGYDIIKAIFIRSNVLLGLGTVYPVLYSLERNGVISYATDLDDLRAKRYTLTLDGLKIAKEKTDGFIKAIEYIRFLIMSSWKEGFGDMLPAAE